jgi:hypothetical protein
MEKMENGKRCGVVVHELKSDPKAFIDIYSDNKYVEIRLDDREYEVHDYILLRQTKYDAEDMERDCQLEYTGRTLLLRIIHIQSGYGLKDGWVALSIRKLD